MASNSSTYTVSSSNSIHSSHNVGRNLDIAHCQILSGLAIHRLSLFDAAEAADQSHEMSDDKILNAASFWVMHAIMVSYAIMECEH